MATKPKYQRKTIPRTPCSLCGKPCYRISHGMCAACRRCREAGGGKHGDGVLDPVDAVLPAGIGPTEALPGTLEKMVILRRRAEARQPLFHRRDRRAG